MEFIGSETEEIDVTVGTTFRLESLRQAVVPPYIMLIPFVELPAFVELQAEEVLDEDGVHGCTFVLKALQPGEGKLRLGFRDLQNNNVTHQKQISIRVH